MVSLHTSPLTSPGSGDAGGMNIVVLHLCEALAALGHSVEILTRRQSERDPQWAEVRRSSAENQRISVRYVTAGPAKMLAKSQQDAHTKAFERALLELGKQRPDGGAPYDVLHSHHWMSGIAAAPVARAWNVPHVQSYHSIAALPGAPLVDGEPPESPDRNAGERHLAQVSDLLIAISHAEAATIAGLGADPARVAVVSPGVDTELFRPSSDPVDTDPGFVLVAARLQPLKGIDLAVEALAGVPESIRPRLVVAGDVSDDFADYRRHLAELVARYDMAEDVHFIGPRTRHELAELLREARLCLIPSHSETFGLIALEAAASGTPVVAAAAGGLREAVADGVSGLLVPERDPGAWAAAITRLLTDPELEAGLRRRARPWAQGFSWPRAARQHADLYAKTILQTPSRE